MEKTLGHNFTKKLNWLGEWVRVRVVGFSDVIVGMGEGEGDLPNEYQGNT